MWRARQQWHLIGLYASWVEEGSYIAEYVHGRMIMRPVSRDEQLRRLREQLAASSPLKLGEVDAAIRQADELLARYEPTK